MDMSKEREFEFGDLVEHDDELYIHSGITTGVYHEVISSGGLKSVTIDAIHRPITLISRHKPLPKGVKEEDVMRVVNSSANTDNVCPFQGRFERLGLTNFFNIDKPLKPKVEVGEVWESDLYICRVTHIESDHVVGMWHNKKTKEAVGGIYDMNSFHRDFKKLDI